VSTAVASPGLAAAPAAGGLRKWAVALTVSLGALLEIVDTSIVNVALTDMQATLGATLSEIGWVVTSYGIANVIILPLSAWLGDRFGKKRYFVFSLVAFTAASILCGLAGSLPLLVVARVLQGLFGGGLLAKAQSILFETFPKEEHAKAQGVFGAVVIAGPAIGPTLGGYIITHADWRWIFFINLPVGVAATLLALAFLPADGPPGAAAKRGVDWAAIALLAVGLGGLQTMLEEGQSEDWFSSPFVVACAACAAFGLVAFVARQLGSSRPVVDLRVLRHRSLWAGCLVSMVVGAGLYGALFSVPIFAQSVLRFTPQQTGMLLLPGAIASAVTMPLAARLARRVDPRLQLAAGALTIVASMLWLNDMTPQTGEPDLFWPLIVRAVGTVLMFIPLSLAALGSVPKREVAAAAGLYNLTRQLGGSIGIAVLATVLERREAFHRAVIVEKLVAVDAAVQARLDALAAPFVARGADVTLAKQRALALLDGAVNLQAAVLSFADTFTLTAALFVAALPLFLLLGRGARGAEAPPAH
jgi:MFS transporter, DHA2 family, multidrug resistance protein